jgi:glycolate oxidase FAD binding subunit
VDLNTAARPIVEAIRAATSVEPSGARTHCALGFRPPNGAVEIDAPSGIVRHDPADLTVTAFAGTPIAELDAALAGSGQFVPLDPFDPKATIGGTLASGLSGPRRLG